MKTPLSPDASKLADTAHVTATLNEKIAKARIPWAANQYKQYFELKPQESTLRAELAAAVAETRKLSQPKPHRFELKAKKSP